MPVAPAQSPLLAAQNVPAPLFIQAGASNAQHLADAGEYREEVKRRRLCHPPSATDADESAAKVYESEIATDLSPGIQAVMTAALINALPNALAVALAPIHAELQNIASQLTEHGAKLANQRARYLNGRISLGQAQSPLHPLVKEIAGHPPQLPNNPALVHAAIGDSFPLAAGFAPTTSLAVSSLTHQQIDDLSWFHNVDFVTGAPIAERRHSVLEFYVV